MRLACEHRGMNAGRAPFSGFLSHFPMGSSKLGLDEAHSLQGKWMSLSKSEERAMLGTLHLGHDTPISEDRGLCLETNLLSGSQVPATE